MSTDAYEATDSGYIAPSFCGVGVTRVVLDHQITLHVGSDTIVIEAPFEIDHESMPAHVVPGDPERMAGATQLFGAVIVSVELQTSGELRVALADGRRLTVGPLDKFESWQVAVRGRHLAVCGPGGILSFFG